MKRTLGLLNEIVEAGILETYAIGGAMAAVFYSEPILTFDLDVFVLLPQHAPVLHPLSSLYDALKARGYT